MKKILTIFLFDILMLSLISCENIDSGNLFVSEDDDKEYTTTNKEEFRKFLYGNDDVPRRTPFWINVQGEKVLSVIE